MPAYDKLFRLDGRRAVVVGAGSGIGRECARVLAAHGAEVICADRDPDMAAKTAELAGGSRYRLDVLNTGAVADAATDLGEVDVLVFTAATNVRKRLLDYTQAEFDRVVGLNLAAPFALARAFRAGMAERGRGSIIGFSSIRAFTHHRAGQGRLRGHQVGAAATAPLHCRMGGRVEPVSGSEVRSPGRVRRTPRRPG